MKLRLRMFPGNVDHDPDSAKDLLLDVNPWTACFFRLWQPNEESTGITAHKLNDKNTHLLA